MPKPESFGAILADPPWHHKMRSAKGEGRSASRHYPVMEISKIKAMDVPAADDCALFIWCVDGMLPQALDVMAAWGFEYKVVAFVWAKSGKFAPWSYGLGYWTRKQAELVLMGTRGRPKRLDKSVPQLVVAPRMEHSRKPDEVHDRIERLVAGPYLELFARRQYPGWTCEGNEL